MLITFFSLGQNTYFYVSVLLVTGALFMPSKIAISLLVLDLLTFLFGSWYHHSISNYRRMSAAARVKLRQNIPEALKFKGQALFFLSLYQFLHNQQKYAGVEVFLTLRLHNLKTL